MQNATNEDGDSRLSITSDTGNDFPSLSNEQFLILIQSD